MTRRPPLLRRIAERRAARPADRHAGNVDGMLPALAVLVVVGLVCLLAWGGPK